MTMPSSSRTPRKSAKSSATQVDAIKHQATRVNIPTRELRDFVAEEERAPGVMLYPRDPSLDPQLVWKGKDEQDAPGADGEAQFAVPVVPVYIHEKIKPQAVIEQVRREAGKVRTEAGEAEQPDMFADFNGYPESFEQRVDFYHHEGHWTNRMILGDSLLVMASLAEKEALKGKVQMIYLDPPYGIKFGSNWQVSTRKRDVKDGKAEDATRQPEQVRAFRDTWKLGIHSYLSYLRDRLVIARDLLTESGSIFVQIGEENVHLVRCVMDEVFGSENFVSQIMFFKSGSQTSELLPNMGDFVIWYAKSAVNVKRRPMWYHKLEGRSAADVYRFALLPDGTRRTLTKEEQADASILPADSRIYRLSGMTSASGSSTTQFTYTLRGRKYSVPRGGWRVTEKGMDRLLKADQIVGSGSTIACYKYINDFPLSPHGNIWFDTGTGSFTDPKIYVVQTGAKVVERCLMMATDPGDLVIDPTCGSGTTAYVAEQWGRRWITIDTSRVALALARTRLMAARYPYYLLADSEEGVRKEAELTGKVPPPYRTEGDIRRGFVYRRVPHITLKAIANNEEIDAIHARWAEKLDPARAKLNKQLKQKWEEWQVPRLPVEGLAGDALEAAWKPLRKLGIEPGSKAAAALAEWWALRLARQREIDDSIARNADTEFLYDQPYEDKRTVRVSGPFTVESLSPHRILPADDDLDGIVSPEEEARRGDFAQIILDNLKTAGVQNTRRDERLRFERIELFSGNALIHAEGHFNDKEGRPRRAALHVGPEYGTVSAEMVKDVAKEAVRGAGFDLLIVLGLAFDAHASETAGEFRPQSARDGGFAVAEDERRYGRLPVLLARINPDLTMSDELLKKTGAGNLFTVFGEPDVAVETLKDGRLQVEIRGLDIYDPTTGELRSSGPDDIACWFIDTDYDGESFFVRQAYFLGGDEPYEKLKRALRAEIDEAAWSTLYSATSRPIDKPESGKIAIKVINHYGDEVLKVYEVPCNGK